MTTQLDSRAKALDLLERYLHKVGEELPAKQRDDVKAELRSLLTEQLDDRTAAGADAEDAATDLLRSFGKPDDVAMRYMPHSGYLIGPRHYPYFLFFTKLNVCIVAGFYLLATALGFITGNTRLPEFMRPGSLFEWFGELVKLLAVNLGFMVAIFAVIERFVQPSDAGATQRDVSWDPAKLPPMPVSTDPDKISEIGLIFKIYVIVALAALLNLAPQWFGVFVGSGKSKVVIPYYALGVYLPVFLMNVWWAGAVALNLWLLNLRRWTREARWIELALGILGGAILVLVLQASSFTLDAEWLAQQDVSDRALRVIRGLAWAGGHLLWWSFVFILIGTVVEAVVRLVRIFRRYPLGGAAHSQF